MDVVSPLRRILHQTPKHYAGDPFTWNIDSRQRGTAKSGESDIVEAGNRHALWYRDTLVAKLPQNADGGDVVYAENSR
jgi:hypothetical protein